jgi:hypothetical protein
MYKCTLALIGLIGATAAEHEIPDKLTRSYRQQFDDIDALLGRLTHDIKSYYCEEHSRTGSAGVGAAATPQFGAGATPQFLHQHLFPLQEARNIPFKPEKSSDSTLATGGAVGPMWFFDDGVSYSPEGVQPIIGWFKDVARHRATKNEEKAADPNFVPDTSGVTPDDVQNAILSNIHYSVFTHEIEMDEFGNGHQTWNSKTDCVSWDPNRCQHFPTMQLALYFEGTAPDKITFKPKDASTFVFWTPTADSCRDENEN